MKKVSYLQAAVVQAQYDRKEPSNPFASAMPQLLSAQRFYEQMYSAPEMPQDLDRMQPEERRLQLAGLSSLFIPMPYMYSLYDMLYRAIQTTYTTRSLQSEVKRINALFCGDEISPYSTQPDCGAILGVPGIGKTSTIRRCLSMMPQVIEHERCAGKPFYCKQVLYLSVECPSDCSVKTLGFNVIAALDRAIGSNYLSTVAQLRSLSASAIATQVKTLCLTHHVGLLLVDEIQNAVATAQKTRQTKPLIRFLVELMNDTGTSVYLIGTPMAEEFFIREEHLKRRTRGYRLLPLKPDEQYRNFIDEIWKFQYTQTYAPLTDDVVNKLYDYSGGVPAYIIKIFRESQAQAILAGAACINGRLVKRAIDLLAIKIPKTYSGGTSISAFGGNDEMIPMHIETEAEPQPRYYANKRGRKAQAREEKDLLSIFCSGDDVWAYLKENHMLMSYSLSDIEKEA